MLPSCQALQAVGIAVGELTGWTVLYFIPRSPPRLLRKFRPSFPASAKLLTRRYYYPALFSFSQFLSPFFQIFATFLQPLDRVNSERHQYAHSSAPSTAANCASVTQFRLHAAGAKILRKQRRMGKCKFGSTFLTCSVFRFPSKGCRIDAFLPLCNESCGLSIFYFSFLSLWFVARFVSWYWRLADVSFFQF